MGEKIIVDTSIVIDHIRQNMSELSLFSKYFKETNKSYVFPGMVAAELWAGESVQDIVEEGFLHVFMNTGEILLPDLDTCKLSGYISCIAPRKIGIEDAQILATAVIHDLPILTLNKKDFDWLEQVEVIDPNDHV